MCFIFFDFFQNFSIGALIPEIGKETLGSKHLDHFSCFCLKKWTKKRIYSESCFKSMNQEKLFESRNKTFESLIRTSKSRYNFFETLIRNSQSRNTFLNQWFESKNQEIAFLIHWFEPVNQETLFSSVVSNKSRTNWFFVSLPIYEISVVTPENF